MNEVVNFLERAVERVFGLLAWWESAGLAAADLRSCSNQASELAFESAGGRLWKSVKEKI